METIFGGILKAIGYILISGIIFQSWATGAEKASGGNHKTAIWKGFLWCIAIALFFTITLGNPSCAYQSDSMYGGCEEYADNGFEPTPEERYANFLFYLTFLYVPYAIGVYKKPLIKD